MDTKQPEALRVAAWLITAPQSTTLGDMLIAGRELRRLHSDNTELRAKLEGFDAADMASAAAQGFRDGQASQAQPVGAEPLAYIIRDAGRPHERGMVVAADQVGSYQRASLSRQPLYASPQPAAQALDARIFIDDDWKARLLDGRNLVRDDMGCCDHPALPIFDEGMKPEQFFDAFGIELAGVMAEDQMDGDAYDAMVEACDCNVWTPAKPKGEGWAIVSIFDTEDGPAAWWLRAAIAAKQGGAA